MVETETEIDLSELPEAVKAEIRGRHPTGRIIAAFEIESAEGGRKYEAEVGTGKKTTEVTLKEDGSRVN